MRFSDLEALLGEYKRFLTPAYTEGYARRARGNNSAVKPERLRVVLLSIQKEKKELDILEAKIKRSLSALD